MRLTTNAQLANARRKSQIVSIYGRYEDRKVFVFEATGWIVEFDKDTITILTNSVGTINFLREKVEVRTHPKLQLRARWKR